MDLAFTPEEQAFRQEVRAWVRANLPPEAAFCPRCGHPADEHPGEVVCPGCHATNLPGAVYCNQCGDRLG